MVGSTDYFVGDNEPVVGSTDCLVEDREPVVDSMDHGYTVLEDKNLEVLNDRLNLESFPILPSKS